MYVCMCSMFIPVCVCGPVSSGGVQHYESRGGECEYAASCQDADSASRLAAFTAARTVLPQPEQVHRQGLAPARLLAEYYCCLSVT